ncbi:MAG: hypothetical protein AB7O78_00035 [Thermoleophilia bacterium]
MASAAFPPALRAFVAEHISSVGELELLLLLRGDPHRAWTAREAASRLHHVPDWVADRLERLVRARMVIRLAGDHVAYRFGPADAALERSVEAVAEAFRARRASMISLIYARPEGAARLSDAFRLRGGDP